MPIIVSPESTLHRVDSEHALDALVARLGLDWQLAGNLRQLCGYRSIDGKGPERTAKKRAAEWKVLDAVVWIKRNNVLLPVVGEAQWFYDNSKELAADGGGIDYYHPDSNRWLC